MTTTILVGDALAHLRGLETESVQCVATSPPYWGLRAYDAPLVVWGGDPACAHAWGGDVVDRARATPGTKGSKLTNGGPYQTEGSRFEKRSAFCRHCNAWRGQLGLEPQYTLYIEHMLTIFREIYRVLRKDGVLWINMGDCYATSAGSVGRHPGGGRQGAKWAVGHGRAWQDHKGVRPAMGKHEYVGDECGIGPMTQPNRMPQPGLKRKDLMGMPWLLARALQQPHYAGRIKEEKDRAWLAALIDGEGSIGIRRFEAFSNGGDGTKRAQDGFIVHLSIANNDRELLDRCVAITGLGNVRIKNAVGRKDPRGLVQRRDCYGWRLDANAAVQVIREVYPHLIAKRRQAILAHNLDLSNKGGKALRGNGPLPTSEQQKRELLKSLCHACNQRQPISLPPWLKEPLGFYEEGWILRRDVIWHKPAPMPESVYDRPTTAHEYLFLFAKSGTTKLWVHRDKGMAARVYKRPEPDWRWAHRKEKHNGRPVERATPPPKREAKLWRRFNLWRGLDYYYDSEAIMEPSSPDSHARAARARSNGHKYVDGGPGNQTIAREPPVAGRMLCGRNDAEVSECMGRGADWRKQHDPNSRANVDHVPRSRKAEPHDGRNGLPRARQNDNMAAFLNTDVLVPMRNKRSVWTIGSEPFKGAHFATMPPALIEPCILAGCPRGGVVLDPFGGAGTTALVADRKGRDSIIIELSPKYAKMAEARIRGDVGPLLTPAIVVDTSQLHLFEEAAE